jgi:phage regulator Rha-like protein
MNNLVIIKNNEPLTTSEIVSEQLKRTHKSIMNLINNYKKDFEEFGTLSFSKGKSTGGRPAEFVYLNEQQLTFLIMNMKALKKEGDLVLSFKKQITKEFFKMRKALLQIQINRQNQEWLETRKDGKQARKELTNAIKELQRVHVELNPDSTYAKKPQLLYSNITRMIDKALFDIKVATNSKRDCMTDKQLSNLGTAELAIAKKIYIHIEEKKDAKETYKILQDEIKPYINFIGGKSTIIDLILNNQISMLE